MAIARVSVLEFDSAEALAFAQGSHKKQRARVFPHMQMCLCIRTSPTSFVDISIYPSEETAEANLEDSVQPPNYVPFFDRVSGTGGLMFRAW